MKRVVPKKFIAIAILVACLPGVYFLFFNHEPIDFNTQVKPIFNKKCISCHGGVKKEAGFSVLFREEALGNTASGKPAIIPGKPGESELIRRIKLSDPEERMPYRHDALSEDEIQVLSQWIKEGAEWGQHWAYTEVKKTELPDVDDPWIKNDIDRFIFEKLQEEKLTPSTMADKATLLRRVSLDLTGLPPTENIANKFLNDSSEKAYENLVDDLLATDAYGERWTALWLDLARYADTRGYEADRSRNIWKYRDWLIKAFNDDKPYNQFLIEQLAGDLMPGGDDEKLIATAFHRNTMTNDEGGTDNEEFRTAAVMDRVNTTWSAIMGTTFNCVQCHSHPYDPFRHEEYYQFMAFFNNSRDEDTPSEYPVLRQYDSADNEKLNRLVAWMNASVSPAQSKAYYSFLKTWQPTINSLQCDEFVNASLLGSWYAGLRNTGTCRLKSVVLDGKSQVMFRYQSFAEKGHWSIYLDSLNGPLLTSIPIANTKSAWRISTANIPAVTGRHTLYFKYYSPALKSADDLGLMFDWFQFGEAFPGKGKPGYDTAFKHFNDLMMAHVEATPIMIENNHEQARKSYIFERGNWMVKADEVTAAVPQVMNPMPANAPKNRLGLAMWLTDKKNPLTARTMVNRLWEQLFGFGLAETLEDLGTQGIPSTHLALLNHLSWTFMHDDEWSIKKLLKTMVMSATYRQSSVVSNELLQKDPANKWLARGPRIRLSAEQIRDQALAVSGVLSKKMYGKSVMPFQPEGIWLSPYNGETWKMSENEDQYRRAVYTYWKRTAPFPSMITFDAGAREVCITRRIRTNTPLQALASLNDSTNLVFARHFAYRMKAKGGEDVAQQIAFGYNSMMYKPISATKLKALTDLYAYTVGKLKKDENATCELVGLMNEHNNPETAALIVVANSMLNLDEWLNKN